MSTKKANNLEQLDYLNGLKALGFILVFTVHFTNIFYPAIYSLNPEVSHTINNLECIYGSTPLNLFTSGKFAVRLFMIISGFLTARRFFLVGDDAQLGKGALKKYFRLLAPIVVAQIVILCFMYLGLYRNYDAAVLGNSVDLFGEYNHFTPNVLAALKEAVFGCFFYGTNMYNAPIWYIQVEFLGTLMIAAILTMWGKNRARFVAYGFSILIFIQTDFLAIFMGLFVAEVMYHEYKWIQKLQKQKWLMWVCFVIVLFIASFPPIGSFGNRLEHTIYRFFSARTMFYYILGGGLLLFILPQLEPIKKFLSIKFLQFGSKISYCFYLIHFPILCTLTSFLFIKFHDKCNYHLLALLLYIITFLFTGFVAYVMNRFIEKPWMKLVNKISNKLF